LTVLAAPIFWAYHAYHSMNAFEPLVWTGCTWLLVRLLRDDRPRLWLAFGLLAGLGLLTKHTTALFGVSVLIGLVATHDRRQLAGLASLLTGGGRRFRALGIAFLAFMVLLLISGGRVYYPAPFYPTLLAFGAVAVDRWLARFARPWPAPACAGAIAASGLALAPMFLPCLPPETLIRYSRLTGVGQPRIENHRLGPLPQLFADRFGWPEMAAEVARVYHALPPEDRERAAIFGQNYGQAGAVDLFGPELGLPKAISGHLAYWMWGPRGATGEVVIVLDDDRETLERYFDSVELAGRVEHPYSMPYQHFDVWVCRGLKVPMAELWPLVKAYD
jgi:hypothetical protein